MTEGYLYCMSNPALPGILKVGFTTRTPEDRAREFNGTNLPQPYKVEFAKLIANPEEKEKAMHRVLTRYGERVNENREFFRIDLNQAREFFDLLEGDYYYENYVQPSRVRNSRPVLIVSRDPGS